MLSDPAKHSPHYYAMIIILIVEQAIEQLLYTTVLVMSHHNLITQVIFCEYSSIIPQQSTVYISLGVLAFPVKNGGPKHRHKVRVGEQNKRDFEVK